MESHQHKFIGVCLSFPVMDGLWHCFTHCKVNHLGVAKRQWSGSTTFAAFGSCCNEQPETAKMQAANMTVTGILVANFLMHCILLYWSWLGEYIGPKCISHYIHIFIQEPLRYMFSKFLSPSDGSPHKKNIHMFVDHIQIPWFPMFEDQTLN